MTEINSMRLEGDIFMPFVCQQNTALEIQYQKANKVLGEGL